MCSHTYTCVHAINRFMLPEFTSRSQSLRFSCEQRREETVWCTSQSSADLERKEVTLTVWFERVKELWAICSTVAVVTCTTNERRMGRGGHAHSDWKSYGRLEGGLILCLWMIPYSQSEQDISLNHKRSVQREDCKQWIPRFSLLWADLEPWDIYSHVGTGVW